MFVVVVDGCCMLFVGWCCVLLFPVVCWCVAWRLLSVVLFVVVCCLACVSVCCVLRVVRCALFVV